MCSQSISLCLLALVLCAVTATAAWADEEIFVLDNGAVVRGYVMRDSDDTLVIRMTGFIEDSRVTVKKSQIVERMVVRAGSRSKTVSVADLESRGPEAEASFHDEVTPERAQGGPAPTPLPAEEPDRDSESFGDRLTRLTDIALPASPDGRLALTFFMLIVVVILVTWGAKLADVPTPSLLSATILGVLFGGCFLADAVYSDELMRADRAVWVIPLQIGAWVGAARMMLGGTIGQVVLLFAFILSSLLSVLFVTGAVFVTV